MKGTQKRIKFVQMKPDFIDRPIPVRQTKKNNPGTQNCISPLQQSYIKTGIYKNSNEEFFNTTCTPSTSSGTNMRFSRNSFINSSKTHVITRCEDMNQSTSIDSVTNYGTAQGQVIIIYIIE